MKTVSKLLLVITLLCGLCFCFIACGGDFYTKDEATSSFSSLENEISALKTRYDAEIAALTAKDSELASSLQTKLNELQPKLDALQNDIEGMEEDVQELSDKLTDLEEENDFLDASVSSLKEDNEKLSDALTDLEDENKLLDASVSSLKEDNEKLSDALTDLEDEIKKLKDELAEKDKQISALIDAQKVAVVYNFGNGANNLELRIDRFSKLTPPEEPEREGYRFDGWYNGNEKWDFEKDILLTDITLTAKWISDGNEGWTPPAGA